MERPKKLTRLEYLAKLADLFERMIEQGYTAEEIASAASVGTGARVEVNHAE